MEFVKTQNVPKTSYKNCKLQRLLFAFADQPEDVMEVLWEDGEYSAPRTVYTTLHASIRRTRMNMRVVMRGDRIFIVKGDKVI